MSEHHSRKDIIFVMLPRQEKYFLILYWLMNKRNFTDFISALQSTNVSLKTFVDFPKCRDNVRKGDLKIYETI